MVHSKGRLSVFVVVQSLCAVNSDMSLICK